MLQYACLWFYAIMICCYATIGVIWPHITSSQLSNTKPDTEYKMSYVNLYNRIYFAVTSRELWPMLDSNCEYSMTNLWCRLWIFVKIMIIHNWNIHWLVVEWAMPGRTIPSVFCPNRPCGEQYLTAKWYEAIPHCKLYIIVTTFCHHTDTILSIHWLDW